MQWGIVNSMIGESGGTTYHPQIPQQKGAVKGRVSEALSISAPCYIVSDSDVKLSVQWWESPGNRAPFPVILQVSSLCFTSSSSPYCSLHSRGLAPSSNPRDLLHSRSTFLKVCLFIGSFSKNMLADDCLQCSVPTLGEGGSLQIQIRY